MLIQQIHDGVGATVKGADKVIKGLKKADFQTEKALNTAVRIEGFRLKKLLQKEIRSGAPGGRRFAPLSFIARRLNTHIMVSGGRTARQNVNRTPLRRLALGIRYHIMSHKPFTMAIGWVGPQSASDARMGIVRDPFGRGIMEGDHVSKSWRRIAYFQLEGFTRPISDDLRRYIVRRGAILGTVEGGNTPFFLKKSTRQFRTPARPIIDPFWKAHQNKAKHNISRNFKRKLKGQRI